MTLHPMPRRAVMAGLAAAALAPAALAQEPPHVVVLKDPTCGCCNGWVAHLRGAGFTVTVTDTARINAVKKRHGVPDDLASCHTAEVGGYVLEGHVPAAEVKRLLAERPQARGLAVPGMPMGSPGMEMDGMTETYEVILFGPLGRRTYARYEGARPL
jgi:hypothetical protein